MIQRLQHIFARYVTIPSEEFLLVQAFFTYYLCIGMFSITGASVANALFLTYASSENVGLLLAWIVIIKSVVATIIGSIYTRFLGSFSRLSLLIGLHSLVMLSIFVFWQVLAWPEMQANAWVAFGLVIWIGVCTVLLISQFFSFLGDYFTSYTAKRVYSYIVAGLSVGSIASGILVKTFVMRLGAENLLFLCMLILLSSLTLSLSIYRWATPVTQQERYTNTPSRQRIKISMVLAQPYLRLIFGLVLVSLICLNVVDFQTKVTAKQTYSNSTQLAEFWGNFYLAAGITEVLLAGFLVRQLLRKLGTIHCLVIQPIIHLGLSLLFYATGYGLLSGHLLLVIASANFFRKILSNTVQAPTRELLFLPLLSRMRIRARSLMGTVIVPIGHGISGLIIILGNIVGIPLFHYSLMVGFTAFIWILLLVRIRPLYQHTLVTSLKNNQIDATDLETLLQTGETTFSWNKLLESQDEQTLRFSLDLLPKSAIKTFVPRLQQLALQPHEEIAAKAIELLSLDGDPRHLDILEPLFSSSLDQVCTAAVLAYCRIQGQQALPRVSQWMYDADPVLRRAAIIGCGRYCGDAGKQIIRPRLQEMAYNPAPEERRLAAHLLAELPTEEHITLLADLLQDSEGTVQMAAIEACGRVQAETLIAVLLRLYRAEPALRSGILEALEHMPQSSVSSLVTWMQGGPLTAEVRTPFFPVLASISGQLAQHTLWNYVTADFPITVRIVAGNALQQMAIQQTLHPIPERDFSATLKRSYTMIEALNQAAQEIGNHEVFTWHLLLEHTQLEIILLFHLLACRFAPRQIDRVRHNFFSANPVLRSNAVELLDDILPRRLASDMVKLLEPHVTGNIPQGNGLSEHSLQRLMQAEHWLRVILAYYITQQGDGQKNFLTDDEKNLFNLLEKIVFLKQVPLFYDVQGNYLAEIARIAEPCSVSAGQPLFKQGDPGDSMYLICQGQIRILVHGREVNRVGEGDYIGEMAVLDNMPRSATCIAVDEVAMLRILGRDFETIVRRQPHVALAVLRTLGARLRQQTTNKAKQQEGNSPLPNPPVSGGKTELPGSPVRMPHERNDQGSGQFTVYQLINISSFLQQVPLFQRLLPKHLASLSRIVEEVSLYAGEILFNQGDWGDSFYVIREGTISIQVDGVELVTRSTQDCLGELALLDDQPRSASAVIVEDTRLFKIVSEDFKNLLLIQPDITLGLIHVIASRLRELH